MRKTWILGALALATAGAAVFWWSRPTPVTLVQPTRGPAIEAVFATGAVEPERLIAVGPRVGARLSALLVDEGQAVQAGQVLARFETQELEAQRLELEARQRQAQLALQRAEQLVAQRFVASSELDRARAEVDALAAQSQRLAAQRGYAQLLAPQAGVVLRRDGEPGQFVPAGQALFQIGDLARLRVSAEVDEEDIARVREGMPVVLRAAALGEQVFDGRVQSITPRGDPVARAYRVRIALLQAPSALRVGMTVDANLIHARREQALLLPASTLREGKLWRIDAQGRAETLAVTLGVRGEGRVELLSGLAEGARVIADPTGLREGQRVRERAAP
ncbi:MAG: efflux RND transporter periplasmic adaptor subunit [Burkholderiales bacterium]|uniref:efflux RND transporter periplasmic adaptor subunit n=1 Tax=Inhella sp. TaxID=1921806 RepID=UPI001ACD495E|nr:efflux RND transporter periplasmic adaptor subunit [Burkholderiales bacterium]